MRHLIQATLLATAVLGSTMAYADCDDGPRVMPKVEVTKTDYLKKMEAFFDFVDTDKNGVMTPAERTAAKQKMKADCRTKKSNASVW